MRSGVDTGMPSTIVMSIIAEPRAFVHDESGLSTFASSVGR